MIRGSLWNISLCAPIGSTELEYGTSLSVNPADARSSDCLLFGRPCLHPLLATDCHHTGSTRVTGNPACALSILHIIAAVRSDLRPGRFRYRYPHEKKKYLKTYENLSLTILVQTWVWFQRPSVHTFCSPRLLFLCKSAKSHASILLDSETGHWSK